jgi:hypothetical protein
MEWRQDYANAMLAQLTYLERNDGLPFAALSTLGAHPWPN